MEAEFAVRLYFADENSVSFEDFEQLPTARPCVIVLHYNHPDARDRAKDLLSSIRKLLGELGAKVAGGPQEVTSFTHAEPDDINLLHVLVCDGAHAAHLNSSIHWSVEEHDRAWILPVMKHETAGLVTKLLEKKLQKRNVAFWENEIEELDLVVLARAGVTCLDRRVFVSYRRSETSPLADQLFDQLTRRDASTC